MASITRKGRQLRDDLNLANGSEFGGDYVPFADLEACSLLARRASRYETMQVQACNCEWANGDEWERRETALERSIADVAAELPGVAGVEFNGDPRGYVVRLKLANGREFGVA